MLSRRSVFHIIGVVTFFFCFVFAGVRSVEASVSLSHNEKVSAFCDMEQHSCIQARVNAFRDERKATAVARRPKWSQRGVASWYGDPFHGRRTANGEIFDKNAPTVAHPTLPHGTKVRIKNLTNGREVVARVNDRGPFVKGRIVDLSQGLAQKLDLIKSGTANVELTPL
jgi:rare lipoprotein A (peptidoglycan hydrolase)